MSLPPRSPEMSVREAANWRDYVALARPSHWVKHVFILPGIVLAIILLDRSLEGVAIPVSLGLLSAACVASANYVLNEWLDARSDAFHPDKARRPAVARRLSGRVVTVEYLLLSGIGVALASAVSTVFTATLGLFLLSGWIYNVPPIRTKDVAYLDVLTESLNNPIRLTLGWAMVDPGSLPPGSLLAGFWMGGAFLMAIKRLAEMRSVDATDLVLYRRSFRHYSQNSLLISAVEYALLAGFFVAVFFVKYRIEYLLALPALAAMFGAYLSVGLDENSATQTPERLIREPRLLVTTVVLVALLILLTWIDLPFLERLTDPHYIRLR